MSPKERRPISTIGTMSQWTWPMFERLALANARFMMTPQFCVVKGRTPMKYSPTDSKMIRRAEFAKLTEMYGINWETKSFRRMTQVEAPITRSASTKDSSRMESTCDRIVLANPGQLSMPRIRPTT
jgi:hypothetical protein